MIKRPKPFAASAAVQKTGSQSSVTIVFEKYGLPENIRDLVNRTVDRAAEINGLAETLAEQRPINDAANTKALKLLRKAYGLAPDVRRHIEFPMKAFESEITEEKRIRKSADFFDIEPRRGRRKTSKGRMRGIVIDSLWNHWIQWKGEEPVIATTSSENVDADEVDEDGNAPIRAKIAGGRIGARVFVVARADAV